MYSVPLDQRTQSHKHAPAAAAAAATAAATAAAGLCGSGRLDSWAYLEKDLQLHDGRRIALLDQLRDIVSGSAI